MLVSLRVDGGGGRDDLSGEDIPLGGRILRFATDPERLLCSEGGLEREVAQLRHSARTYDPELLNLCRYLKSPGLDGQVSTARSSWSRCRT